MSFLELAQSRSSVRAYRPDAVPDAVLDRVLEAARLAPSACNLQPWHLYVVRDPAVREALFPTRMAWAAAAPVAIVACSRPSTAWTRAYDGKNHADIDLAILMDHLILAATDDGLATCWICAFDPAVVRAALHLPDDLEPVAITPLGHADAPPREKTRKCLAETVTWV